MAIPSELLTVVDVGDVANDGTGDDLRDAFIKINAAFDYVGNELGFPATGANIGNFGSEIFKEQVDGQLRFRKVQATSGLSVSVVNDSLVVVFNPTSAVSFNNQNITGANGIFATSLSSTTLSTTTVSAATVAASNGFTGNVTGNVAGNVTGNLTGNVTGNVAGNLTGNVTGNVAGNLTGNVTGNVTGLIRTYLEAPYTDVTDLERRINTLDYGVIRPVFMNPITYILHIIGTDMGTINNPSDFDLDAGTI